jgi:hypothetical protein
MYFDKVTTLSLFVLFIVSCNVSPSLRFVQSDLPVTLRSYEQHNFVFFIEPIIDSSLSSSTSSSSSQLHKHSQQKARIVKLLLQLANSLRTRYTITWSSPHTFTPVLMHQKFVWTKPPLHPIMFSTQSILSLHFLFLFLLPFRLLFRFFSSLLLFTHLLVL